MTSQNLTANGTEASTAPVLVADTTGGGSLENVGPLEYEITGTAAQIQAIVAGLKASVPENWSGTFDAKVDAIATEAEGDVAVTQGVVSVAIAPASADVRGTWGGGSRRPRRGR